MLNYSVIFDLFLTDRELGRHVQSRPGAGPEGHRVLRGIGKVADSKELNQALAACSQDRLFSLISFRRYLSSWLHLAQVKKHHQGGLGCDYMKPK